MLRVLLSVGLETQRGAERAAPLSQLNWTSNTLSLAGDGGGVAFRDWRPRGHRPHVGGVGERVDLVAAVPPQSERASEGGREREILRGGPVSHN